MPRCLSVHGSLLQQGTLSKLRVIGVTEAPTCVLGSNSFDSVCLEIQSAAAPPQERMNDAEGG